MSGFPEFDAGRCLNTGVPSSGRNAGCHRCAEICPADAIRYNTEGQPHLYADHCTRCGACIGVCPTDAVLHAGFDPERIVEVSRRTARRGRRSLQVACSAAKETAADVTVPCHAVWDPLLLAGMAATGIRRLEVAGTELCTSCSRRHGGEILQQCERNYIMLNQALAVRLQIHRVAPAKEKTSATITAEPEPPRRAFFRRLIPALLQTAAAASTQLREEEASANPAESESPTASKPVRLRLFLQALPRLGANFHPVPFMPSVPLGAVQANENCSACGRCIEACPTRALALRPFGINSVLEFKPHACTGCNRCVDICPERAMEALPGISLPVVAARQTRPLVMVTARKKAVERVEG